MDCSPPAPLLMGFSRQEYWNGLPCPSPGDLPDSGIELGSPALQTPLSWLFPSGGQSIGASASASVLPMNIHNWFPLELTGLISLLSKGLWRVFSSTTIWKWSINSLALSLLYGSTLIWESLNKSWYKYYKAIFNKQQQKSYHKPWTGMKS